MQELKPLAETCIKLPPKDRRGYSLKESGLTIERHEREKLKSRGYSPSGVKRKSKEAYEGGDFLPVNEGMNWQESSFYSCKDEGQHCPTALLNNLREEPT